ncbi:MAG: FeoA family protein [Candidatus Odinarchaeota archaeon]
MDKLVSSELCNILKEIYRFETMDETVSLEAIQRVLNLEDKEKFQKTLTLLEEMHLIRINWRGRIHLTNKGRATVLAIKDQANINPILQGEKTDINVKENRLGEAQIYRLMDLEPPAKVEIVKILPGNPMIEKQLLCIGVIPGVKAEILTKSKFGGTTILKISGFEVALSRNITHRILVKRI